MVFKDFLIFLKGFHEEQAVLSKPVAVSPEHIIQRHVQRAHVRFKLGRGSGAAEHYPGPGLGQHGCQGQRVDSCVESRRLSIQNQALGGEG